MTRLEDIKKGSVVKGIIPNRLVTIRDVNLHAGDVLEVTYEDNTGQLGNELETNLERLSEQLLWQFKTVLYQSLI